MRVDHSFAKVGENTDVAQSFRQSSLNDITKLPFSIIGLFGNIFKLSLTCCSYPTTHALIIYRRARSLITPTRHHCNKHIYHGISAALWRLTERAILQKVDTSMNSTCYSKTRVQEYNLQTMTLIKHFSSCIGARQRKTIILYYYQ